MAWNRIQAARLLSGKEMELFEASLGDKAPQMSDKELAGHIRRVRTQRDKFQDLLRRQRVSTRERTGVKAGKSGVANARTEQKVQVFSEALTRLEKQQARRERSTERESSRPAGGHGRDTEAASAGTNLRSAVRSALSAKAKDQEAARPRAADSGKKSAKAPSASRAGPSAASQSPPEVPNAKRAEAMGQARSLAHVSSRGRRQQARRDGR
jgi:hypothetical protein